MKIESTRKNHLKVIIIAASAVVLIAVATFLILRLTENRASAPTSQAPTSTKSTSNIPGPTAAELQASANQKQDNITEAQQAQSTSPSGTQKQVSVVIVGASQTTPGGNIEVRAYTPDVVETGGTCSVTLTQSGQTNVTASSAGLQNAQTTQCSTISIPAASFPSKGTWTAVVTYSSASSIGSSQPINVIVN